MGNCVGISLIVWVWAGVGRVLGCRFAVDGVLGVFELLNAFVLRVMSERV